MTIRAARYLQVPPWDLEEKSVKWRARALCAQAAEASVEREKIEQEKRKGKRAARR